MCTITPLRTRRGTATGFTLLELMMTLVVVGVLATIAVPNMRDFIRNNRLTGEANDLLHDLQQARSQAIKQQINIAVCFTDNPTAATPTCSYAASDAWMVFQDNSPTNWQHDNGETILSTHVINSTASRGSMFSSAVTKKGDNNLIVSYNSVGFLTPAGAQTSSKNIVFCDSRGNQLIGNVNSTARALSISDTGRPRVTKLRSDVTQALSDISTTCP